jgi:hypothetical protein
LRSTQNLAKFESNAGKLGQPQQRRLLLDLLGGQFSGLLKGRGCLHGLSSKLRQLIALSQITGERHERPPRKAALLPSAQYTVCFKARPGLLDGCREVSPDTAVSQKSYGLCPIVTAFRGAFFSSFLPDSFFAMSFPPEILCFSLRGRPLQSPRQSLAKYSESVTHCKKGSYVGDPVYVTISELSDLLTFLTLVD